MKTKRLRSRGSAAITTSRWAAYATAGAATALLPIDSAEADIVYSGLLNRPFADTNPGGPGGNDAGTFALGPNAQFVLLHAQGATVNQAGFLINAANSAMFRGSAGAGNYRYPSRLGENINVSLGNFVANVNTTYVATLVFNSVSAQGGNFTTAGLGFVGFKFDSGSGTQYGWLRLDMNGPANGNTFTLVDFAYASPGEQIATGQVPEPASLAFLAFGGAGLLAWRKCRSKAA